MNLLFNDQFNSKFLYINVGCGENNAAVSVTCCVVLSLR